MRSTVFKLDPTDAQTCNVSNQNDSYVYRFTVPTLDGYAVEYVTLHLSGRTAFLADSTVQDGILEIHCTMPLDKYECRAVIHFHGIRNYSLLFPNVNPTSLQERLGMFYLEAEHNFESGSWLSFLLMCGAIFEGVLFSKLQSNKSFKDLISEAASKGVIDSASEDTMQIVRSYRNLVHANKHNEPYVSRADAMDTRRLLDKIVKNL